jgi:phosphoribosyl 1,2-cyclic phosphodiesterase
VTVIAQSLGSGSSGNALLIKSDDTAVVVDCGVSWRTLRTGLANARLRIVDLDAILLTHEHSDHVKSLPEAMGEGVAVIATGGTAHSIQAATGAWQKIGFHQEIRVKGLTVRAIPVSHDAAEPCGFVIDAGGTRITVVTDVGCPDDALLDPIAGSDLIVLEANHDTGMVRHGPYPALLKRRVLSRLGHLSNVECAQLLTSALSQTRDVRTIWLAHLSQVNNRPDLAQRTVADALARSGQAHRIVPLARRASGPIWRSDMAPETAVQMQLPFA